MDAIDKREKRSERGINVRHTAGGKGDTLRINHDKFSEGHEGIDWSKKGAKHV